MNAATVLYGILALMGILLLALYGKTGKLLKCLFFTAFTGLGALGVVWLAGKFIAMPITITPLSLGVSGLLGVPGVVAMLLFQLI